MRFRIIHLLGAMAYLAMFAAAFTMLGQASVGWVRFVGCVTYALLAIRAIARPGRERTVLASALVGGLPYFWFATFKRSPELHTLPTTQLASQLYHGFVSAVATPENPVIDYGLSRSFAMQVMHVAFSFVFAIVGGMFGAYWSKPKAEA